MIGKAIIIPPGDAPWSEKVLTQRGDHRDTQRILREAVGGDLEIVPGFNRFRGLPCWALCDEHGKLEGLPVNMIATELWDQAVDGQLYDGSRRKYLDYLVGPVVVIIGDEEFMAEL